MEWDGSIKTLPEHETDASREGEWGSVTRLGSLKSHSPILSSDEEGSFTKHQLGCSWGCGREHFGMGRQTANTEHSRCLQQPGLIAVQCEQYEWYVPVTPAPGRLIGKTESSSPA